MEWKNSRPEAALPFLDQAAKLNPDLRIVQMDLGAIYLQKKNYKSAKAALLRAIALDPDQPDAHYQVARIYQALANKTAADAEVQKAQDLHKKAEDSLVGKISTSPPALNSPNKEDHQ